MFKTFSLASVCLLLIGCATSAVPTADIARSGDTAQSSLLQQAQTGQVITVDGRSATVLEEYVAASGRSCKKLLVGQDQAIQVACRTPAGEWYLRKPLHRATHSSNVNFTTEQSAIRSTTPAASEETDSAAVDIAASVSHGVEVNPGRLRAVAQDENLWRFSKRVTGNALNWQRIAEFNEITNVTALKSGVRLAIPPEITLLPGAG